MALADRDYMRQSDPPAGPARPPRLWQRLRFFLWRAWRRLVMGRSRGA